ncbi:DNA repair protein REV1 [Aplochiton taeniatus]
MSRNGWGRKRDSDDNGWASRGGYMAAKVSKLEEQFKLEAPREKQNEVACSNIFSGVAIYVNGYTDPCADGLRRLMMLHGGQFHLYYSRSKTTHIIASNLPNNKVQELRTEKVVRPDWITDSVKAGHLLPYLQYQLYAKQKGLNFPSVLQPQAPAGASHEHLRPSLHSPQTSLSPPRSSNVQSPVFTHNQLASNHHENLNPISRPIHLSPGSIPPGQLSPLVSLLHRPIGQPMLSRLSPQTRQGNPGLVPDYLLTRPNNVHTHSLGQPLGPPPSGCVRPPPPAYPYPQQGNEQPLPSLSSNPIQLTYREPDFKQRGSLQPPADPTEALKMTEAREGECRKGSRSLKGVSKEEKEPPLTNGHGQPVNGALTKPLDLSSNPGQVTMETSLSPCRPQRSERRPVSPPSHTQRKSDPFQFPQSPPRQPNPLPVSPHRPFPKLANEQRLKPPPPTYQEATAAESHPLQSLPPKPCQSGTGVEKTHAPSSFLSPSPSPVRLNGNHPNTSPSKPAPMNMNNTSTNTMKYNPAPTVQKDQGAKLPAQLHAQTGGIISEYYSHSRLHHISTWRNEFSEYVNTLQSQRRAKGGATFSGKDKLKKNAAQRSADPQAPSVQSCILHVDMDCFFVSVGIRHRPDLKGKPVAVTSNRGAGRVAHRPGTNPQLEQQYYQRKLAHPPAESNNEDLDDISEPEKPVSHDNGMDQDLMALSMAEIASCSYEARQAGVKNGMFFGQAKRLCPTLQSVPYDFQAYKEVALALYETLASYTHDIEALSCDEALMEGTALLAELGVSPKELAEAIRADVMERTGCSASVGMGSNILLARMATRKAKPDGHYFLRSEEVDDFIRDQSVNSLPGVGRSMGAKLVSLGVRSCGDLQQVSLARLQKEFGPRTGQTLYRFCRGLDDRPVRSEKERKSVSAEMNYNIRFTGVNEAESFLTNLSMEVEKRLQGAGLQGRKVTLKVMVRKAGAPVEPSKYGGHGICDNLARSVTLAQSTDSGRLIAFEVIKLFHAMKLEVQDMRGVGLQVQLLEGAHSAHKDSGGPPKRSIKDMLLAQRSSARPHTDSVPNDTTLTEEKTCAAPVPPACSTPCPAEAIPGTSTEELIPKRTPNHIRTRLNFSIEVPSPSQVDRSVLEALPAELREQVEQSWTRNEKKPSSLLPPPSSHTTHPATPAPPPCPPVGTLVLQIPNQPGQSGSTGIILELPDFSQVDPEVFAALPPELQKELRSAYSRRVNAQPQGSTLEQRNPLLQLKQSAAGVVVARVKRRYKRKNAVSPSKKGASPLKRPRAENGPAKASPQKARDASSGLKTKICPSTSSIKEDIPELLSKFTPRPSPTLAGACDFTDIRTLLREWVTTISEPMEEDILQVVKYCTDLIEDKDLEKLDLVIKYMKRLMQQSVESVWSMAFDFILDNVQVVIHQTYGSTLKIT